MKISSLKKLVMCTVGVCGLLALCKGEVYASIGKPLPVSQVSNTFPTSYEQYINKLKKIYPNATFKAVYTGLDWNKVLQEECYEKKEGISLIPSSYSSVWKKDGKNIYKDGYFVVASKNAVAYVLDPRNSLYEKDIFQFEGLSYNSNITTSVIEKVIASSPMVGTYAKKYKKAGTWMDMDMSYAEIINKVGKELGVSSVYIASRMMQETSGDIVNNGSVNGSNTTYPGIYNFFNIGATPNSDGSGAVENGLKKASDAGWTTPYLSIYGGVNIIKSSYIKYGQDTVYFQKFDVNNPYGNATALVYSQYQTNIMAPTSESIISYNAYKKLNMLGESFAFYIPVYNNMPEDPTPYPALDTAKFETDNTKVYLDDEIVNGTDLFNIRSSASTELDNVIYTVTEPKEGANNRIIMTRTKKGNGFNFDYVEFTVNGKTIKGYAWAGYVQEYDYAKVSNVTLDKTAVSLELGETLTLQATIAPTNAKYKDMTWTVGDSNVASIENGKIIAKATGTTTVTVTTKDQSKTASCTVTVTPKVPSIFLDKEEYTVAVGKTITPQVTLKNLTSYTAQIVDTKIASISNGVITGLTAGETILRLVGTDASVTKEVKIIVGLQEAEVYEIDKTLNVKDNVITKINPGTIVSNVLDKIKLTNLIAEITNVSGTTLANTAKVGTGTVIKLLKEDKTEYLKLTVVICGDVTGDGEINSADLLKTVKYLKGTVNLNTQAGDVTKDGVVNSADLLKTVKYLKGSTTIDFN